MSEYQTDPFEAVSLRLIRLGGLVDLLMTGAADLTTNPFDGTRRDTMSNVYALMDEEVRGITAQLDEAVKESKGGVA